MPAANSNQGGPSPEETESSACENTHGQRHCKTAVLHEDDSAGRDNKQHGTGQYAWVPKTAPKAVSLAHTRCSTLSHRTTPVLLMCATTATERHTAPQDSSSSSNSITLCVLPVAQTQESIAEAHQWLQTHPAQDTLSPQPKQALTSLAPL
jgi:hypothetical protein